ncbi:MAG: hypothetical protein Q8M24_00080 [Pseudolabrys sp.]|nr:hypothetical protein [Pseudolabrys sp.]MDP2293845.1 hypothetical protein [Pseudolabrys sp.]
MRAPAFAVASMKVLRATLLLVICTIWNPLNVKTGFVTNANADACWDKWRGKLNGIAAEGNRYEAMLKRSGDCAYVEKLLAVRQTYNSTLRAVPCQNMRKNYGWSDQEARARWTKFCKPQAPATQQIAGAPKDAGAPLVMQNSASCSDITSKDWDKSRAAPHCKDAIADIDVARMKRKTDPELSRYAYRKASEAARRAGDTNLELSILREAAEFASSDNLPSSVPSVPAERVVSGGDAQSGGNPGQSLAPGTFDKADTTNDPRGSTVPTPYRPPASVHMGNRPINQGEDLDFGLSAETRRKLDEALRNPSKMIRAVLARLSDREKTAAVDYLMEKLKPTGKAAGPAPGMPSPQTISDKRECGGMYERLKPHAPNEAWIVDQMARSYCSPDGKPMSLRDEIAFKLKMLDQRIKASEANSGAFDCSYKPAGGGAAWDATCAPNGSWPSGATCNAGEVCPDDAVRHPTRRSAPSVGVDQPATSAPGSN